MESRERVHGGSRNYHLQRRDGITAAEADAIFEAQGGSCALCAGSVRAEHVDHDHLTGNVRGMLCCCNQGLSNVRDRADVLELAIAYLRTHRWQKRRVGPGVCALTAPQG